MTPQQQLEIPARLSRGPARGEDREIESASWHVDRMCQVLGVSDLRDTEVLDVGCGVKLTKLFINHGVPIERYVGVDVSPEIIEFLRANVVDPRFEYAHVNIHNDRYNPTGDPFTEDVRLPLAGDPTFDLICLFSVFTHLAPPDYRAMLRLVRRYVRPDGHLLFTLYVNEITAGGHGLIDAWTKPAGRTSAVGKEAARRLAAGLPAVEPFVDLKPAQPLTWAVYSREHAHELIQDTGWKVVSLSDPDPHLQHHFHCVPA